MPQATILLLDQARATRAKAERARRLAEDLNAEDVVRRLRAYAEELETLARHFEDRAAAFRPEIARTRALGGDVASLTAEAARRVQELQDNLTPK